MVALVEQVKHEESQGEQASGLASVSAYFPAGHVSVQALSFKYFPLKHAEHELSDEHVEHPAEQGEQVGALP